MTNLRIGSKNISLTFYVRILWISDYSNIFISILNLQIMATTVAITATFQVTNWAQNWVDYQVYFNVHKGQIGSPWSNYVSGKLFVCINSFLFTVREWQNKVTKFGPGACHLPCHQAGLAQWYLPVSQSSFHFFFFCHGYTKRRASKVTEINVFLRFQ